MTKRRSDTKRRILDITERLLMQRGYHAFSFQHVADELGIKSPAIHYHYRTKPALVSAMMERYRRRFVRWNNALADEDAVVQLDAYVELSRGFVHVDRVCALGMMSAEFNTIPEAVQAETLCMQQVLSQWLTGVLQRGRDAGLFTFDGPPQSKASEIGCTMLGAQQLARMLGAEAFEGVAAQVWRSLSVSDHERPQTEDTDVTVRVSSLDDHNKHQPALR